MTLCSSLPRNRVSYMDKNRKEEIWKRNRDMFGTKERGITLTGGIIRRLVDFTEEYGKTILEKSQEIIISIIKMAIQLTIVLKIWSAFTNLNTTKCILMLRNKLKQCTQGILGSKLWSGIDPTKEGRFRDWQGKNNGLIEGLLSGTA